MKQARQSKEVREPRKRPLGLLIAVIATALVYGVGPLIYPILFIAFVVRKGGPPSGVDSSNLAVVQSVVVGVVVLLLCLSAWMGRPRWGRLALIGVVWAVTIFQLVSVIGSLSARAAPDNQVGGDLLALVKPAQYCELILLVLIPLYITWYLNRAPARAFYAQGK